MKFLVDECLHESLVSLAQSCGHDADHVNWVGLRGWKDWKLMRRVISDDYTLVTNNARDFRMLFSLEPIHAGLVIIVPNVPPAKQQDLFLIALDRLVPTDDLINKAIEVSISPAHDYIIEIYEIGSGVINQYLIGTRLGAGDV